MPNHVTWPTDRRFVRTGLYVGIGFYIADAAMGTLLFGGSDFLERLLTPTPRELWTRAAVLVTALVVGGYADWSRHLRRRQKAIGSCGVQDEGQRIERFLDISEAIIVALDACGRVTFINKRGADLLGYSSDELIGRNWFTCAIPAPERETVATVFQQIMHGAHELVEYFENNLVTRNGQLRHIAWHNALEHDDHGNICGTLSSGQDITDRKEMEDRLRLTSVVFESTNQGVVITDADVRIISVNPAFTAITGFTADEVLGSNPRFLHSGHHDAAFYEAFWEQLKTTGNWTGEIWDRRASGEPFPSWQTISAIRNAQGETVQYISVFSDISPIKADQRNLDFLAHHDPLTGLPNRVVMDDRLDHALKRRTRKDRQLALLFLDLNGFKPINDTLGHAIGDNILKQVASRLEHLMRGEDTITRFGGDEFVIILEGYETRPELEIVAEKILKAISTPIRVNGHTLTVTTSIGIAIAPEDGNTNEQLLTAADHAMYHAKRGGGKAYCFHGDLD